MAIRLQDKTNTDAPDGRYIYGAIRDDNGSENGTPINMINHQDFHQFFSRMMAIAGVNYNGYNDDDYNGFQLFEALEEIVAKFKTTIAYNASALLTDAAFGRLNIMYVNSDETFTLPPATVTNAEKKLRILKLGTGKLTVVTSGGDTFLPAGTITLLNGGYIELTSDSGSQYIIHSKSVDQFVEGTSNTENGLGIDADVSASAPFATANEQYFYNYQIKDGYCDLSGKAIFDISDGAVIEAFYIPLPNGINKDMTVNKDYALHGGAKWEAPLATSNYGDLIVNSIRQSGVDTQTLEFKRNDGTTSMTWETGSTVTLYFNCRFKVQP